MDNTNDPIGNYIEAFTYTAKFTKKMALPKPEDISDIKPELFNMKYIGKYINTTEEIDNSLELNLFLRFIAIDKPALRKKFNSLNAPEKIPFVSKLVSSVLADPYTANKTNKLKTC